MLTAHLEHDFDEWEENERKRRKNKWLSRDKEPLRCDATYL
jgi:hypothetical protein